MISSFVAWIYSIIESSNLLKHKSIISKLNFYSVNNFVWNDEKEVLKFWDISEIFYFKVSNSSIYFNSFSVKISLMGSIWFNDKCYESSKLHK